MGYDCLIAADNRARLESTEANQAQEESTAEKQRDRRPGNSGKNPPRKRLFANHRLLRIRHAATAAILARQDRRCRRADRCHRRMGRLSDYVRFRPGNQPVATAAQHGRADRNGQSARQRQERQPRLQRRPACRQTQQPPGEQPHERTLPEDIATEPRPTSTGQIGPQIAHLTSPFWKWGWTFPAAKRRTHSPCFSFLRSSMSLRSSSNSSLFMGLSSSRLASNSLGSSLKAEWRRSRSSRRRTCCRL
jgi:hypothetical protein